MTEEDDRALLDKIRGLLGQGTPEEKGEVRERRMAEFGVLLKERSELGQEILRKATYLCLSQDPLFNRIKREVLFERHMGNSFSNRSTWAWRMVNEEKSP